MIVFWLCERLRLVDVLGLTPSDKIRARYPQRQLFTVFVDTLFVYSWCSSLLVVFLFLFFLHRILFVLPQYYRSFSSPFTGTSCFSHVAFATSCYESTPQPACVTIQSSSCSASRRGWSRPRGMGSWEDTQWADKRAPWTADDAITCKMSRLSWPYVGTSGSFWECQAVGLLWRFPGPAHQPTVIAILTGGVLLRATPKLFCLPQASPSVGNPGGGTLISLRRLRIALIVVRVRSMCA